MPDQADQLRQLAIASPPPARGAWSGPPLVALTGGKMGVGTTTVAVNLGAALADAGRRVVIVDAAMRHANLAQVAGIEDDSTDALSDVLSGNRLAAATLRPGPAGTLLLASAAASRGAPDHSRRAQQRLLGCLQSLAGDADLILVDTGSGVTHWTRRLWQQARLVLVVTAPDDVAIRETYATIKLATADQLDAELCLLVNQCEIPAQADQAHRRLAGACQQFLARAVPAMPSLPIHQFGNDASLRFPPRIWELPDSPFGHAVLWLRRAVTDKLAGNAIRTAATSDGPLAA
jgi:MinD-like ATPase involved in chromosome partitioning or flagellar assembly